MNRILGHVLATQRSSDSESEWENNLLFELLNQRCADMTDTILTCNLSVAVFEASLGPSIVSRISEGGGIVECNWPSFRA